MVFRIRDDIRIRSKSPSATSMKDYYKEDLAKSVAYYVDEINKLTAQNKSIGIMFGFLSFASTSFMLALVKSKVNYTIVHYVDTVLTADVNKLVDHVFFLGPLINHGGLTMKKIRSIPGFYTDIGDETFENPLFNFDKQDDLNFEFADTQQVYLLSPGADSKKLVHNTGKIEESSIIAAMKHYFEEDDYCVLARACAHVGVATLSLYPAIFKAKTIVLCSERQDWDNEIASANHVHLSFNMIKEQWPLPKKLRMITTGGYAFNSDCVKYVTGISEIEQIIDCYGTQFFPPPLAIREISKIEDNSIVPFRWVNEFVCPLNINDILCLRTSNNTSFDHELFNQQNLDLDGTNLMITNDAIKTLSDDTFYFYGQSSRKIRINDHKLYKESEFIQMMYEEAKIKDFKIEFTSSNGMEIPLIKVKLADKDAMTKFVKENKIEINLIFV